MSNNRHGGDAPQSRGLRHARWALAPGLMYTVAMFVSLHPRRRLALIGILLLAFALRLYRLGADSLWYDETVSAVLAAKPLAEMWRHTAGDIHPPLYYALLHFWQAAAGRSEFALAFFSLGFGMLNVAVVAHLGRWLYGATVGLWAALLAAIAPAGVWYSQEVRMYTLGVFLLLLCLRAGLGYMGGASPRRSLVGYMAAAALALWTLYYSAFALVALNLFLLPWLWFKARPRFWPWLAAQAGVLLLYLPWLPTALRQAFDPPVPPWREALPLVELLRRIAIEGPASLTLGQSLTPERWWPVGWLGVLVTLVALRAKGRGSLLWFTLLGPLLLIVLASQTLSPLYHVRYLYLYSGAFPILLAAGLHTFRQRGLALLTAGLAILLITASLISLRSYNTDRFAFEAADDLRGAVHTLAQELGPRDAVLIHAGYLYPAFVHYWPGPVGWLGRLSNYPPAPQAVGEGPVVVLTGHIDGDPGIGWGDPRSDFYAISAAAATAHLRQLFADFDTVWVLRGYDTVSDPQGVVRGWLEAHGALTADTVYRGQTYVRTQAWRTTQTPRQTAPTGIQPLTAEFIAPDASIQLLGYDLRPAAPRSGQPLRLALYWQSAAPLARSYKVFTQLLDEGDQVISQDDHFPIAPTDQWLPGEVVEASFVLPLPAGLPTGAPLRLLTGFYDEGDGQRLLLRTGADALTLVVWP